MIDVPATPTLPEPESIGGPLASGPDANLATMNSTGIQLLRQPEIKLSGHLSQCQSGPECFKLLQILASNHDSAGAPAAGGAAPLPQH